MKTRILAACMIAAATLGASASDGLKEAADIQALEAKESGRASYSPTTAVKFKASDNVYLRSTLAVDFTYNKATATLPLFRGLSPKGEDVYYIITESSDFKVAEKLGVNYAPKMKNIVGTEGAQLVTLEKGLVKFKGDVDFSPKYEVKAGSPAPFPPTVAKPGAVADGEWSSMAVMPSGNVLNIQLVQNKSGAHDRLKSIDLKKMAVTLSVLDGFQDGKQYFYHLVTDVSADVPAVLEQGVYAPKLALIPAFGKSEPSDKSALLGFSPVVNGISDVKNPEFQGFEASLANGGIDPINVFPIGPKNDDPSESNNYSPLWDAHVVAWTPEAVKAGKVRRIKSFEDLKELAEAKLITSANPDAPGNPWLFGLKPLKVTINCPVIVHPATVK
ncbi:MAG: hypothetical protein SGJ17_12985 [Hyphomicrobiales bacterium]|nr:hypothetical protein [Hyphomicrobiales bacterium]